MMLIKSNVFVDHPFGGTYYVKKEVVCSNNLFFNLIVRHHPHSEEPQSVQMRQPS